ncbi:TDP-N-acetylfucosamine:lipid II N-acetylfucosaminyltransferase [Pseudoalteromonas tunicata]|uniref:TDP-N-acetylfucosamine:lipid II N-acetylfucosaminyltransferase n=1 Tax=Pseudoalteromonas tunicata TaxID=314281 RepID=UPI00273D2F81|nr:TDP-N-acetylfucosamine:lipid II N-acetylfucosaminyltransferase [Pseudoalteromonas tunicata]MDP4982461.1 TDP-N-acetylfucosamine:lipid II N-acetylfucosaminyltransferase [Pseudoalteromonas tunicata]
MIIHIFADTPHHYQPMQRFFSTQCVVSCSQQFWVRSNEPISDSAFISYSTLTELFILLGELPHSAKVIFHGLFDTAIWQKLLFNPIITRSYCVIWGAELYRHQQRGLKAVVNRVLHGLLLHKMAGVFTLTPGDAQLVASLLKRKNAHVLPYPLIGLQLVERQLNTLGTIKILVGNSAAPSNEHFKAFSCLAHLATENIEIIVPLNYGGEADYIAKTIKQGRAIFADKFKPITDMLSKEDYDALLQQVSLTVFSQQRQQGLYVVYAMLLQGKPIFLNSTTTSFVNLASLGFEVGATEQLSSLSFAGLFTLLSKPNAVNQALMQNHFTEQALGPKWSAVLNELSTL